jgi:hypothetical protein
MRSVRAIELLLITAVCSCSMDPAIRSAGDQPRDMITINVVGGCPPRTLENAIIELRTADNRVLARAVSGVDGAATFSHVSRHESAAAIVCHEDFFCGVLDLRDGRGSSFFIALAPAMVARHNGRPAIGLDWTSVRMSRSLTKCACDSMCGTVAVATPSVKVEVQVSSTSVPRT